LCFSAAVRRLVRSRSSVGRPGEFFSDRDADTDFNPDPDANTNTDADTVADTVTDAHAEIY
jgi:hypothetical protein